MKILFLSDDFPPLSFGGAGVSTSELAIGMKEAGHEVFSITTCRSEKDVEEAEYKGIKVFKIVTDYSERWRAYLGLYNPRALRKLETLLKQIRPDVVHVNNVHYYLSYHSMVLAKKYAKAVVFTARDTMAFSYGKLATKRYIETLDPKVTWLDNLKFARKRWNPFRNLIIRYYLRQVDRRFSVSDTLRKALLRNGIKDVEVMHTGARVEGREVSPEGVASFKQKHGIQGKKVVLFSGRVSVAKGGGKVLEALAQVVKEVPSAVLMVAGKTDAYSEEMTKEAHKLGLLSHLVFIGWIGRDEMKEVYASSDIVLVPSLYLDAFPRTVLSAMASGRPVIGTRYGGAPEIIEDGITGYIVNPFKVEEIAEKITDLLKHNDKAEKFGKAGLERVKANFNLKDKVAKHIAIYEKLS